MVILRAILAMHYRLRFDPHGLNKDEIKTMTADVSAWLSDHERRKENAN